MEEFNQDLKGSITFEDEVIAKIAGLAALRVSGLAGMSGSIVDGITELIGKQNFSKGVKIDVANGEAVVNLQIIAEYGLDMPSIFSAIQDNVKNDVEKMTGLKVTAVNIHVQDIISNKENEMKKEKQTK